MRSALGPVWAVAGSMAVGVVVASCAAQSPRRANKTHHETKHYAPSPYKQEIMVMWEEIRNWRKEAKMDRVEPPRWHARQWRGRTVAAAKAVCTKDREPKTPKCRDVCSIADNICNNAEDICRIADENLPGDPWARDKCDSAKASCNDAKKRCCKCNGSTKTSEFGDIVPDTNGTH